MKEKESIKTDNEEGLWVCMDKDGSIHLTDLKPYKPSDENPNHNDSIFTWNKRGDLGFWMLICDKEMIELLKREGLTFENSPMKVKLNLIK